MVARWVRWAASGWLAVRWLRLRRFGRLWARRALGVGMAVGLFGLGVRLGQEFSSVDVRLVSESSLPAWLPPVGPAVAEAGAARPDGSGVKGPGPGDVSGRDEAAGSGPEGDVSPCAAAAEQAMPRPINVNVASAEQLQSLPGIGPVLARRIVEWRERVGPFERVDDLVEVPGVGPRILERLRGWVVAETP